MVTLAAPTRKCTCLVDTASDEDGAAQASCSDGHMASSGCCGEAREAAGAASSDEDGASCSGSIVGHMA